MPRVPNTRPTSIYWLFDARPETLVQHPDGRPFYCGKTVLKSNRRFAQHRNAALKHPTTPIAKWLNECGDHVRVQVMEHVVASDDWAARERFWISMIRLLYPGGANITAGGDGTPGNVQTAEARAKIGASKKGKKRKPFSAEWLASLSFSKKGKPKSAEHRLKTATAKTGKKRAPFSAEWRANLSAAQFARQARLRAAV